MPCKERKAELSRLGFVLRPDPTRATLCLVVHSQQAGVVRLDSDERF